MIKESIAKLVLAQDLLEDEAVQTMKEIMGGEATPAQIGSFITALRMKGEKPEEISGLARVMREFATRIEVNNAEALVDTCGTGGDGANTFNISTASALVAAGAGVMVAKHGNRAVSSQCGSADVLAALGVNVETPPSKIRECIDTIGIGFLFAPGLHKAMKHAIGPRKEIGIRTVFNILGPLTNPAGAPSQVLGVFDGALTEVMANVLKSLGSRSALVVHGEDGLDEISLSGPTRISELKNGTVSTYTIQPEDVGAIRAPIAEITGGSPKDNAGIITRILDGEKGPKRDVVCLNAAAAIVVGGKAGDLKAGFATARESIDSGKAKEELAGLVRCSKG